MLDPASDTTSSAKQEGAGSRPYERKHDCWMCELSFYRPSTLRKHILVHTGEKTFVCGTCGRRFGTASNLDHHVKRCILNPVDAANRAEQMNPNITASSAGSPLPMSTPTGDTTSRSAQKHTHDGETGPESPSESPTLFALKLPVKRYRTGSPAPPSPTQSTNRS